MAIITETDHFVQDSANNFIYNRFDIIYPGNYKCLCIQVDDTTNHIGLHMDGDTAYLGVWCIEIPETAFTDLTHFVFRRYSHIKKLSIQNCAAAISKKLTKKSALQHRTHWTILLPTEPSELDNRLSSKKRYNIKREKRIVLQDLGDYTIQEFSADAVSESVIETYFRFKELTHGIDYHMSPREYLDRFHVSNIYTLCINHSIESILFSCEQGAQVYLENLTYNPEYQKYSLGSILYDEYLKRLSQKGKERLYLGWGNQVYKTLYGAVAQPVSTGIIYRSTFQYLKSGGFRQIIKKCKQGLRKLDLFGLRRFLHKS